MSHGQPCPAPMQLLSRRGRELLGVGRTLGKQQHASPSSSCVAREFDSALRTGCQKWEPATQSTQELEQEANDDSEEERDTARERTCRQEREVERERETEQRKDRERIRLKENDRAEKEQLEETLRERERIREKERLLDRDSNRISDRGRWRDVDRSRDRDRDRTRHVSPQRQSRSFSHGRAEDSGSVQEEERERRRDMDRGRDRDRIRDRDQDRTSPASPQRQSRSFSHGRAEDSDRVQERERERRRDIDMGRDRDRSGDRDQDQTSPASPQKQSRSFSHCRAEDSDRVQERERERRRDIDRGWDRDRSRDRNQDWTSPVSPQKRRRDMNRGQDRERSRDRDRDRTSPVSPQKRRRSFSRPRAEDSNRVRERERERRTDRPRSKARARERTGDRGCQIQSSATLLREGEAKDCVQIHVSDRVQEIEGGSERDRAQDRDRDGAKNRDAKREWEWQQEKGRKENGEGATREIAGACTGDRGRNRNRDGSRGCSNERRVVPVGVGEQGQLMSPQVEMEQDQIDVRQDAGHRGEHQRKHIGHHILRTGGREEVDLGDTAAGVAVADAIVAGATETSHDSRDWRQDYQDWKHDSRDSSLLHQVHDKCRPVLSPPPAFQWAGGATGARGKWEVRRAGALGGHPQYPGQSSRLEASLQEASQHAREIDEQVAVARHNNQDVCGARHKTICPMPTDPRRKPCSISVRCSVSVRPGESQPLAQPQGQGALESKTLPEPVRMLSRDTCQRSSRDACQRGYDSREGTKGWAANDVGASHPRQDRGRDARQDRGGSHTSHTSRIDSSYGQLDGQLDTSHISRRDTSHALRLHSPCRQQHLDPSRSNTKAPRQSAKYDEASANAFQFAPSPALVRMLQGASASAAGSIRSSASAGGSISSSHAVPSQKTPSPEPDRAMQPDLSPEPHTQTHGEKKYANMRSACSKSRARSRGAPSQPRSAPSRSLTPLLGCYLAANQGHECKTLVAASQVPGVVECVESKRDGRHARQQVEMQELSLEMQVDMQELSFRTRQSGYLPPHKTQHDKDKTQHDKNKMHHDRDKHKYNVPGQIREPDHVLPHNMQHDKDKDKVQGQLSKADVQHHTVGVQCLKVHRFARSQGVSLPLPLTHNTCNRSRSHNTRHTTKPSEGAQGSSLGQKMCAYGLCPSPMHSKKWRVVTAGTSAGARDWDPLVGQTLCDPCYSTFRKHGTFVRSIRTNDGWSRSGMHARKSGRSGMHAQKTGISQESGISREVVEVFQDIPLVSPVVADGHASSHGSRECLIQESRAPQQGADHHQHEAFNKMMLIHAEYHVDLDDVQVDDDVDDMEEASVCPSRYKHVLEHLHLPPHASLPLQSAKTHLDTLEDSQQVNTVSAPTTRPITMTQLSDGCNGPQMQGTWPSDATYVQILDVAAPCTQRAITNQEEEDEAQVAETEADTAANTARGKYKCGICGQAKKGHTCRALTGSTAIQGDIDERQRLLTKLQQRMASPKSPPMPAATHLTHQPTATHCIHHALIHQDPPSTLNSSGSRQQFTSAHTLSLSPASSSSQARPMSKEDKACHKKACHAASKVGGLRGELEVSHGSRHDHEEDVTKGLFLIEAVVSERFRRKQRELLVLWKGYGIEYATWEAAAKIPPGFIRRFIAGELPNPDIFDFFDV